MFPGFEPIVLPRLFYIFLSEPGFAVFPAPSPAIHAGAPSA